MLIPGFRDLHLTTRRLLMARALRSIGLGGVLSGTTLAGRIPEQKLSKAFGWFTIIVALFLIYENLLQ